MSKSSHFGPDGGGRMVNVGAKPPTDRYARASAEMAMQPVTLEKIKQNQTRKGDVLGVARLAGIMACKKTGDWIPLCHPLGLDGATVTFEFTSQQTLRIICEVQATAKTGVEMEALTGAAAAALTVYDMCKSVDREMRIENVQLEEKVGGKSGHFVRSSP